MGFRKYQQNINNLSASQQDINKKDFDDSNSISNSESVILTLTETLKYLQTIASNQKEVEKSLNEVYRFWRI